MLLQAFSNKQALLPGAQPQLRAGRTAELMVSELNGRYYQQAQDGLSFTAALQSAIALSTLSKTGTGFILTNPINSGVNVALLDICIAFATAPAGVSNIHLANGLFSVTAVTQGTPLTVYSTFMQGLSATIAPPQGLAASAATLPNTPVIFRPIGGGPVATGGVTSPYCRDEVAGLVILAPGTNVSLGYLTTAVSVVASMVWTELPT